FDPVFEDEPADSDRNRTDRDEPREPCVLRREGRAFRQRAHERAGKSRKVAREVDENGEQGAKLNNRSEICTRIGPSEECGNDGEVCSAANRKKLCEPLDDSEDDSVKEVHPYVRRRRDRRGSLVAPSKRVKRRPKTPACLAGSAMLACLDVDSRRRA